MTSTLTPDAVHEAAQILLGHWRAVTRLAALPDAVRPHDRAQGYAVQAEVARLTGQPGAGWKIAATSIAGQRHIGVDGPLAGRLLADRMLADGAEVSLAGNGMRVAELEFGFRMARALAPRTEPYSVADTLAAVATLHLTVELPDSRFEDFEHAGAPQLIADFACANRLVVGPAIALDWRARDLSAHAALAYVNGAVVARGSGANVLGDPREALAWIANELRVHAGGLAAGDLVTTGTCVVPVPVREGDDLRADFGDFGTLNVRLR